MKKRILAVILAVAMVAGVCTFASADTTDVANTGATPTPGVEVTPSATATMDTTGTVWFTEDFEGDGTKPAPYEWWGSSGTYEYATVDGHDGNETTVLSITNTGWGTANCGTLVSGLDASKTYTISLWHKGDVANLTVAGNSWLDAVLLGAEWQELTYTFTGKTEVTLTLQCQSAMGYMGGTAYIDDITIVEGEVEKENPNVSADPNATPGSSVTATPATGATTVPGTTTAPSVTPSSSATAAPTDGAENNGNGSGTVKKSVKFAKKKVTIKKGKKATLKVTIKGAKKATFSVDKKGKKVVKLSKKKAKSVVVTGKKKGKATITAKAAGKKATCKVTVK